MEFVEDAIYYIRIKKIKKRYVKNMERYCQVRFNPILILALFCAALLYALFYYRKSLRFPLVS